MQTQEMGNKFIWGEACTPDKTVTSLGRTSPSLISSDISSRAGIGRESLANLSWAFNLGISDSPSLWEVAGRVKTVEKWGCGIRGTEQNP